MNRYKYIILGGGLAGGYAAKTFVETGIQEGELAIISAEGTLPYERPPLSKSFLAGKEEVEEILINDPDFYTQNGIDVHLNCVIDNIDFEARKLYADHETFDFEKLLIATGSRIRTLDTPGSDLEGLYYLRKIEDSKKIRKAASEAKKAVVIGGSFIGMEVASVLHSSGVETTLVFPEDRVWASFFTPEMSRFFERYYKDKGVTILPQEKVAAFKGNNGRVSRVILKSGQALEADMVVAGIGVVPNSQLFENTPIQLQKNGIKVNKFLETTVKDVFAAGDIAAYPDDIFDKVKRVEHWDNAVTQAQHAAQVMVGNTEKFEHIPYFFSDVFDLSYEFWGDTEGAAQIIHRGDLESDSFSVWWLDQQDRLLAAFVMNRPDEERDLAQRWIRSRTQVDKSWLEQNMYGLEPLIDENSTGG